METSVGFARTVRPATPAGKDRYNPAMTVFSRADTEAHCFHGITAFPDGIVGEVTWNYFNSFLRGYDTYSIRPGDTLYQIARKYYTTVSAILTANPGINPMYLRVGQRITVPYGLDVVFTDVDYTYSVLEMDIEGLEARYPFIETGVAGKSV
jgi:g-D-glutamyl-meso-diaminopimelate peptidase